MEHVIIYFTHSIRDIIPYSDFINKLRPILEKNGVREYLGDDMAIDGGDAEAVFSCHSAQTLYDSIQGDLELLPFMRGAKVTFFFGALDLDVPQEEFFI
ncbi:hypothetical protein KIF53_12075 [Chromobacterium subtsugae]|uniref:Uncharacterized protein n=1 Tax=Chromobacterium subtsugae TaxID=251747 RepID=A0ABS7FE61_9NEIS|nr:MULTISPECIES: hypothetical protein [Chromobacterium]MBW7566682.1 hypothetical protein [Chromobacterium subtsugae]MBW8288365.1 hypothetical protein [Chromobacterium subtsugae]WSE92258.1 hypothetical protein U6115_03140 [Chromobacterium subtsugae]WVH60636.1 hypothetical protein U6151_03160 [Chromobacterium subtsugae]